MERQHAGGLPKQFLQPSLLLLLKERPGYGYELVARLKDFGIDDERASVYRALRALEDAEAVASYWNTAAAGPARRMYRLSPTGHVMLEATTKALQNTHLAIERLLCRHALACNGESRAGCAQAALDGTGTGRNQADHSPGVSTNRRSRPGTPEATASRKVGDDGSSGPRLMARTSPNCHAL